MSKRRALRAFAALFFLLAPILTAYADDWANCPIQTGGQPSGPQGPTCSLQDIGNALQNTYNGFTNGDCAVACDNTLTCALAVWATVAVGGMGSQSQGFCDAVSQASNWTGNAQTDATNVGYWLNQADSSLGQQFESYLNTLENGIADIIPVETSFTCACSIAAGLGQTFSDLGACVQSALCWLSNAVSNLFPSGWISSCDASISISWGNCDQLGCAPAGSGGCSIICNTAKTVCFQPCGESVAACSCPPPMVLGTAGLDNPVGGYYQHLVCNCPPGSHLPPNAGGVVSICVCDNDPGRFAQPGVVPAAQCPPPLTGLPCKKGETRYGGTCLPTCPAGTTPLFNGQCCAPSQASSCGQCCPAGEPPNPRTGGCGGATTSPRPIVPRGRS